MLDTKYLSIIKAPVITEKAGYAAQNGKYVFEVEPKANKIEIKNAIEKIFNVHVTQIRTLNCQTKKKRVGRYTGRTNNKKKAYVTLAEGESIDFNK